MYPEPFLGIANRLSIEPHIVKKDGSIKRGRGKLILEPHLARIRPSKSYENRFFSEARSMAPREEKLTRDELEKITSEIRILIGDKLKNHKDGDAERLLFKMYPKKSRAYAKV